jgi:hypothetical protein
MTLAIGSQSCTSLLAEGGQHRNALQGIGDARPALISCYKGPLLAHAARISNEQRNRWAGSMPSERQLSPVCAYKAAIPLSTTKRRLRAHPRRSRCLMLRPKPDIRSGRGLRLLEDLLELPQWGTTWLKRQSPGGAGALHF